MRFVPVSFIEENMILAKTIYDENGIIILSEGQKIKKSYIDKIKNLNLNGIYVEDKISENITSVNLISEDLKIKAKKKIKEMFLNTKENNRISEIQVKKIEKIINEVIEQLFKNEKLIYNIIDLKIYDEYTYNHSINVTILSLILGIELNFNKEQLKELGLAAIFHDIGKIFIPKEILNKPGKLDKEELEVIKKHPQDGYILLKNVKNIPKNVCIAVKQHHEKYNGIGGYPDNLKGEEISLYARIISIADVYDALISDRPYRKGLLPSEAIEFIIGNNGIMFDPQLVSIFIKKVMPYPLGTLVELSNGLSGIVVENYEEFSRRPKIKVIMKNNKILDNSYYVDLLNDLKYRNVTITRVLKNYKIKDIC